MALWDDERAQPIQIGFILVFAVLIISFAVYQSVFVPQQNAEIEFQHYKQVGQDMTDLRNGLIDAIGSNNKRSGSVKLGTTYPARVFALNPAPPGGTLATTAPGEVEVRDLPASAADLCAENENTVESRSLVYRPSYNEYGPAESITYENSFVVRSFRDGERYGSQDFVEEAGGSGTNRINLRLVTNEFGESGTGTASVDLEPSRTNETTFSPGSQFSVVVPSEFQPGTWRTEIVDVNNNSAVNGVRGVGPDRVEIVFEPGDYTIACTAVGLNEQPAYQPPVAPSGTGTTGGNQAYNTSWDISAIESEEGVQGCSGSVCTYDRNADSGDDDLELTAFTDPAAVDATLEFALNDTGVGTLSTDSTATDSAGKGTTTLQTSSTGWAKVYVSSGGSGDVVNISVVDAPPVLSYMGVFNDGDGTTETNEDDTIPPSSSEGDLENFANTRADDGDAASISESGGAGGQQFVVGMANTTGDIPSGTHSLEIKYQTNGETVAVDVVNQNGDEVDSGTTYTLSGTAEDSITLSSAEQTFIDNNGEVYLVFTSQQASEGSDTVDIDYVRISIV